MKNTSKSAIQKMQSNRVFRLLSSVKMAVPVLLLIAGVVAIGTLYESRYNAEYARLMVYQTVWFEILLGFLGMNIFLATLSRLPWRKAHIGFLITHLGMITLLVGSWITKYHGIDGQLYVLEGQDSREVALDNRVLEISGEKTYKKVAIERGLKTLSSKDLSSATSAMAPFLEVFEFRPFVILDPALFNQDEDGLSFRIKSAFFDETVRLTANEPEMKMGPATFRLVKEGEAAAPKAKKIPSHAEVPVQSRRESSGPSLLVVKDKKSSRVLREIAIEDLKKSPILVGQVQVGLKRVYQRAVVSQNAIEEGGEKSNPAVEIEVKSEGKSYRDVLFARFPDFSMTEQNDLGVSFAYLSTGEGNIETDAVVESLPAGHPLVAEKAPAKPRNLSARVDGNLMEFRVAESNSVQLVLSKSGQQVLNEKFEPGKTITTPWMGMQITLLSVGAAGELGEPQATVPIAKSDRLPPSAMKVKYKTESGEKTFWLVEGQSRRVTEGESQTEIYYGREIIKLPFSLHLDEFHKKDYPGTQTAMSFESDVKVDNTGAATTVSMNEPLKRDGFTLYQASYEIGQDGGPDTSVFSVNRDPGRAVKYLGSFITGLGIIIFTLSRSRIGRRKLV